MKINKIKILLPLSFLFIFFIFYTFHINNKNERIEQELTSALDDLKIHYSLSLDYFYTDVKTLEKKILNDKKFLVIMKQANSLAGDELSKLRDELYNHYIDFYNRIEDRGYLQFQFMFPNNVTFLRMHKSSKFGDDLTNIRYSYKYVNENHKTITGFEQGKTVHSIRYVFPVFDENKNYLCAVDLALSTSYLQEKLEKSNKIHTHFIVDKNIFEVKKWKKAGLSEKYIPSIENENYLYTLTSHNYDEELRKKEIKYLANKKVEIAQKMETKQPFNIYIKLKDTVKIVSFLPIHNIKEKRVVAYLVSYVDDDVIFNILNDADLITYTMFIVLLIIFYFIYKILINKENLEQEVIEKTKELKIFNDNLKNKIQKEVSKNQKAQEQIFKQEKRAIMGDMLENIAHQWRQPLSVITTNSSGIKLQKEMGILTDEEMMKSLDLIQDSGLHLSETINDFRSFYEDEIVPSEYNICDVVNKSLMLTSSKFKNKDIEIINKIEDINIIGYKNEMIQIFMNILSNARDAFETNSNQRKIIILETKKVDNILEIILQDSAGGIPENIIDKIFEQKFTTKQEQDGTGIGLFMSKSMVEKANGTLIVKNREFELDSQTYKGACFLIKLDI